MQLVTKFTGIVVALIMVALAASGFLLWRLAEVNARYGAMLDREVAAVDHARALSAHLGTQQQEWQHFLLRGYNVARRDAHKAAFIAQDPLIKEQLDWLGGSIDDAEALTLVAAFRDSFTVLRRKYQTAMTQFEISEDADFKSADQAMSGLEKGPIALIDQLVARLSVSMHARIAVIDREQSHERVALLSALGATLACALLVALALTRALARTLRDSVRVLVSLAEGDFTVTMDETRQDELGDMARALNRTVATLRELLTALNATATQLHGRAAALNRVSGEMSTSAGASSDQANASTAASQQVAANTSELAKRTAEMEASIKELATNTSEVSRIAMDADRDTREASEVVGRLGISSREIDEVVQLIHGIAEQTNLLALNATIEAARSGEAGRGFAVVATEVKELARQTALATSTITGKINAIQKDSQLAHVAISHISAVVKRIAEIQQSIASAVEEQAATTMEMNRSTSGVAGGARASLENLGLVVAAARATSAAAGQTLQSAHELSTLAASLQERVAAFRR
jgi:methyl-accepting chemotaxis protein